MPIITLKTYPIFGLSPRGRILVHGIWYDAQRCTCLSGECETVEEVEFWLEQLEKDVARIRALANQHLQKAKQTRGAI